MVSLAMLAQLIEELSERWRGVKRRLAAAWVLAVSTARVGWGIVRPPLLFVLQVIAALIVLFEEWGWRPLVEALGRLARFAPWAAFEFWIAGLSPYGALAVFALPTTILLPLKFVAMFLLANGFYAYATALFIGAKIASTALIARIFMLTKPALMQIGWFARGYNFFMPWKEYFFEQIRASWAWRYGRMVKTRVKLEAKQAWVRWKPKLQQAWQTWGPPMRLALQKLKLQLREAWGQVRPKLAEHARRVRGYFGQSQ